MSTPRLLPMLATPGSIAEVTGDAWVHEFKWDGVRALVASDGRRLQVRSRAGNDVTAGYPELAELAPRLAAGTVVDGEIVALDERGAPSFPLLQHRMHLRDPARVAVARQRVPVRLLVFDLLAVEGRWLLDDPWEDRRGRLEALGLDGEAWAVPPVADDLHTALEAAQARGLEGVVSKRRGSRYRLGERSPDWRKLRLVREQDVVVGGWRHGEGRRADSLGSLLVGTFDEHGDLRFGGGVGTGFTDREVRRLAGELTGLVTNTPPFVDPPDERDVTWVRPELVVRVRYREWTPDGRLRQASYRGQRTDVDPRSATRDA